VTLRLVADAMRVANTMFAAAVVCPSLGVSPHQVCAEPIAARHELQRACCGAQLCRAVRVLSVCAVHDEGAATGGTSGPQRDGWYACKALL